MFLFLIFSSLIGEWLVNSEHSTVHFCRFAGKKRPAIAGQGRLFRYGVITFRQPVGVAFFPERQIGLYALIFPALFITQPVLFQHGRQPLVEHGEAQGIPVAVGFHIRQIGMIQIQARLTRNDVCIANIHTLRFRQCFKVTTKIKCRVGITFNTERLVGVLL